MKVPSSIFISVILSLIIISCSSNIKPLPQNVEASENPIKECPNNMNNTFVHLKSSSRKGYYDIGVNKRRINRILKVARKKLTNK